MMFNRKNKLREQFNVKSFFDKKTLMVVFLMSFLCTFILVAYYYVSTSIKPVFAPSIKSKEEVEILIDKDLDLSYPSTPKEVLGLYLRMEKCFYNDSLSNSQLKELVQQSRILLDDELIEENLFNKQVKSLEEEIAEFKERDRRLTSDIMEDDSNINYWTYKKDSYASLVVVNTFHEMGEITKVYEEFVFRQDKEGRWKILGWGVIGEPNQ